MGTITIPKTFKLLGQTVTVCYDSTLRSEHEALGLTVLDKNQIRLQPSTKTFPMSKDKTAHVFCHELVHLIFYHAGFHKDCTDERKVDLIAGLLHQALITAE